MILLSWVVDRQGFLPLFFCPKIKKFVLSIKQINYEQNYYCLDEKDVM